MDTPLCLASKQHQQISLQQQDYTNKTPLIIRKHPTYMYTHRNIHPTYANRRTIYLSPSFFQKIFLRFCSHGFLLYLSFFFRQQYWLCALLSLQGFFLQGSIISFDQAKKRELATKITAENEQRYFSSPFSFIFSYLSLFYLQLG